MKMTFVVRSLATGGAERQVVAASRLLAESGYDVQLIVLSPNMSMADPLRGTSVDVVVIEKTRRWQYDNWMPRLRMALRERLPGVVCPWQPAEALMTMIACAGLRGARILWSVRCSELDMRDYDLVTRGVFWMHRQLVAGGSGAGAVFNSFAGARHYGVAPNGANYSVIWNSVDFEAFRPDPGLGSSWLESAGLPPGQKLVVSVGRIAAMKDHVTFVRAAARVLATEPDARFAIVGEGAGHALDHLKATIQRAGLESAVMLLGRRADIPAALNAASVVVSSSRYGEGVQNSLAEAMACGRPVVATDVGDAARFLSVEDMIVAPGDAESMARAIVQQFGQATADKEAVRVAHAKSCFSSARMLDQLERCISAVAH